MADCPYLDKYEGGCTKTGYFCINREEFRKLINDIIEEFIPKSHKQKRRMIYIYAMIRFWEICRKKLEEVDPDGQA